MVFGRKEKGFKAGEEFGPEIDHKFPKEKSAIKERLKGFARLLAQSYGLAPKDKKKVRSEMTKLNKRLKQLEKEEKVATVRYRIAEKEARIRKLSGQGSSGTTNYASQFTIPNVLEGGLDIHMPDLTGLGGGSGRGKKRKGGYKPYVDIGL